MKIIKSILSLFLCALFLTATACSSATVYNVEKEINQYVVNMTAGATQYTETPTLKYYELYNQDKVLNVKLKQGLKTAPSFEITTGKNKKKTLEQNILTVYATKDGETALYGTATAMSRYFDPYRNTYVPCMRVYKINDETFRALFFITNSEKQDDFFPFYLAFTGEGYKKALTGIENYMKVLDRSFSSHEEGASVPDYVTEFKNMFAPVKGNEEAISLLYGDKFTNLSSDDYVLYQLGSNYPTIIDEILPQYADIDMQYMRSEYEKLGYVDYDLDIIIVTADIKVSDGGKSVEVTMNEEVFYSEAAKTSGVEYTFEFCPILSETGKITAQ
jgi:hypothetical protein